MKLTASKMSRAALARANSIFPRDGRCDFSNLFGCTRVGVGFGRVGFGRVGVSVGRVGFGRVGVSVGRVGFGGVGVGVGTRKGTSSCESGKGESEDDFELHFEFFGCKTEH